MVDIIGGEKPQQGPRPKLIIEGADAPARPAAAQGAEAAGGAQQAPAAGKIQVDEDWKEQAKREAEVADKKAAEEAVHAGDDLPPADFLNFTNGLVEQCLMELGAIVHPMVGQRVVNPPMAKYSIECLDMLREKTKGNLTAEEQQYIDKALHSLRIHFVNVTQELLKAAERGELKTIGRPGEGAVGAIPPKKGGKKA
jgi:hypothetical protein